MTRVNDLDDDGNAILRLRDFSMASISSAKIFISTLFDVLFGKNRNKQEAVKTSSPCLGVGIFA